MRNFCWLRVKRHKALQPARYLNNLQNYAERAAKPKNVNVKKSHENRELSGNADRMCAVFLRRTKDLEVLVDSVICLEVVASFSRESPPRDIPGWALDTMRFLNGELNADNLMKFYLHMDETTPHVHAYYLPINKAGKLSCRSYAPHGGLYSSLLDRYAEAMACYGLQRGIKNTRLPYSGMQRYHGFISVIKNDAQIPPPEGAESAESYRARLLDLSAELAEKCAILRGGTATALARE